MNFSLISRRFNSFFYFYFVWATIRSG